MPDEQGRIPLAIIGCGGMGNRHLRGLGEYVTMVADRRAHARFRLIAVCDPNERNRDLLADAAQVALGERPRTFAQASDLIGACPTLESVAITTEPRLHEAIAVQFLQAGVHVLVEKPMALTVSACNAMMGAATVANRILCIAENYRFDPLVRLTRALIVAGAIGDPWMFIDAAIGSGGQIVITPWRHKRLFGGTLLDIGVHNADLMRYQYGAVEAVSARVSLRDVVRTGMRAQGGPSDSPGAIYAVTNANLAVEDRVTPDIEDTAFATVACAGGMVGQWTLSQAGHGQGYGFRHAYGSRGSMEPAPPRTGRGPRIWADEAHDPMSIEAMLTRVPDFHLDEATATLFGGDRLGAYNLGAIEIDRKIQATVFADFGRAIATNGVPEVGGVEGRHAVAVVNAMFESSLLGRAVSVAEVEAELPEVSGWQIALDHDLGRR